MRRKVVAVVLAAVLCMSMSMTAFAASSTTESNSSNDNDSSSSTTQQTTPTVPTPPPVLTVEQVVEQSAPGQTITPERVKVAVATSNGQVATRTLDEVVRDVTTTVTQATEVIAEIAQISQTVAPGTAASDEAEALIVSVVQNLLTAPVSPMFTQTVAVLAQSKGADIAVNNCGTVKTAAIAQDALGNTIASAGIIPNVTSGALIMLMSVNEDGTIEYVEGIVDPVTGMILGMFKGTPGVITVLVLA